MKGLTSIAPRYILKNEWNIRTVVGQKTCLTLGIRVGNAYRDPRLCGDQVKARGLLEGRHNIHERVYNAEVSCRWPIDTHKILSALPDTVRFERDSTIHIVQYEAYVKHIDGVMSIGETSDEELGGVVLGHETIRILGTEMKRGV